MDDLTLSSEARVTPETSAFEVQGLDQGSYRSDHFRSPSNIQSQNPLPQHNFIDFEDTTRASHQNIAPHRSSAPDPSPSNNELAELNRDISALEISSPRRTEEQPANPQDVTEARGGLVQAQPSEIYGIRVVNWRDGVYTSLRQTPVLVQNENGPCPLLALVNSLVLRTPPDVQSPLIRALKSRESISLGLLIQTLFDELTTYVNEEHQLPDIEDLSAFLTMLHTGMNVNPRLTPVCFSSSACFSPLTFLGYEPSEAGNVSSNP